MEKSTNADSRVFKPKTWATPDRPERYAVKIFYRQPPEMCQDDSPFYLSINHMHKPGSYWYTKQPLGIHKIDAMMKKVAAIGNLTGKKKTITLPGRHKFRHRAKQVLRTQQ